MPRQPRVHLENALYYVTVRGNLDQNIYKDEGDYKMFLDLLKKYKEMYGCKIFSFVFLPNHFHLVLEMPLGKETKDKKGISDFMHDLNSSYTKYFNGRYHRKGHLFRERFKTALVEKEIYTAKLTAYVHLNPQKANLVSNPKEYDYSSYLFYLNKDVPFKDLIAQEKNEVLELLGGESYEQFMEQVIKEGSLDFHKDLQRRGILGRESFERIVRERLALLKQEESRPLKKIIPGKKDMKSAAIIFVFAVIGLGLISVLYIAIIKKEPVLKIKEGTTGSLDSKGTIIDELDQTEWQISITSDLPGNEADIISFTNGKFSSGKLSSRGYAISNYSFRIEDGKTIIWETMQTGAEGTASWRGEFEAGKMKGILSLRENGKQPQDFSFVGIKYWRKR